MTIPRRFEKAREFTCDSRPDTQVCHPPGLWVTEIVMLGFWRKRVSLERDETPKSSGARFQILANATLERSSVSRVFASALECTRMFSIDHSRLSFVNFDWGVKNVECAVPRRVT